jgi:hypothetical protein
MKQTTMRRKPKKSHPWLKFDYFGSKPKEMVDLLGYIVEGKNSKKQRRLINKGECI